MARNCIICGKRAGSREHIFPAALGGRRVNKGIYCGEHNNGYSPLAAILSDQLAAINALLAVRPDHDDEPRQFSVINPADGHEYLVSGTKIEQADPIIVAEALVGGARHVEARFSSESQIREWLAAQRAAGMQVQIERRREGTSYFTRPYAVQLRLGGLDGLRAIGYVMLTFLAHYFPGVARQPEMKTFKDFTIGSDETQPVWWDFGGLPSDLPPNSFRFGHRILVGISATRQEAYARVSLFSTLDFAVRFGKLRVDSDQTVVVDIDPQADKAPGDINEMRKQRALGYVDQQGSLTQSLQENLSSGEGKARFERLLQKITDWQMECIAKEMLPKIVAAMSLGAYQRHQQVKRLLSEHGQCVLNLMLYIANGLKQQFVADPATAALASAVDLFIAEDSGSETGLSQTAVCTLELATTALADQICQDHDAAKLDCERLSLLLGGGPGAGIVARVILEPLMKGIGVSIG